MAEPALEKYNYGLSNKTPEPINIKPATYKIPGFFTHKKRKALHKELSFFIIKTPEPTKILILNTDYVKNPPDFLPLQRKLHLLLQDINHL